MATETFVPGQRWLSNNEPELGLGLVIKAERGRVSILFPASGQTRVYTTASTPLTRIAFGAGDEVHSHDGTEFIVEKVEDKDGVLTYFGPKGKQLPESGLSDSLNFSKPWDRLINAQLDDRNLFNLRSKALHHRFETLRGHQRGFVGPKIDLIPHQLFVALQMRRKGVPRVVLADESGVGKAIEACLVLHRLWVTSRIERALIIVASELLSRWQFELERRFNMTPVVIEPSPTKRGVSIPEDARMVLATPQALTASDKLSWDLLIVDDADSIPAKDLKSICASTPGVILLTDLPPETEIKAHATLRTLLDADKGTAVIEAERATFLAEKLMSEPHPDKPWTPEEITEFQGLTGIEPDPAILGSESLEYKEKYVAALLEAVGGGRRLLRNTRNTVEGLPERESLPIKLTISEETPELLEALRAEFLPDGSPNPAFQIPEGDPRFKWLSDYLENNPKDKMVLICATKEKADSLAGRLGKKAALHHEGLSLSVREQAVARFTEKNDEGGAHVLVCSEFGTEARSFSFAHHLVMFDLPCSPLRLQKRIGSLDRYGHMAKVRLHIPYVEGTPSEAIYRWYHEGLNMFEKPLPVVHACEREYREKALACAFKPAAEATTELDALLPELHAHRDGLMSELHTKRDRLTSLASMRAIPAGRLYESVRRLDSDLSVDFLMLRLFEHFGFEAEDISERTYRVKPKAQRKEGAFPEIGEEGLTVIFERQRAMNREDATFLTWDHPIVMNNLAHLINSTEGNSCYAVWEDLRSQLLLLESLFRIELAENPPRLYTARFFSPAGLRLIIDHAMQDVSADYPMELINRNVRNGRREWIRNNNEALRRIIPPMLQNLHERAMEKAKEMSAQALTDMETQLVPELERLQRLRERGGPASDKEITLITDEIAALREILAKPMVKLDAIRLVRRGPAGKGI